jgi:hypothetical protein
LQRCCIAGVLYCSGAVLQGCCIAAVLYCRGAVLQRCCIAAVLYCSGARPFLAVRYKVKKENALCGDDATAPFVALWQMILTKSCGRAGEVTFMF